MEQPGRGEEKEEEGTPEREEAPQAVEGSKAMEALKGMMDDTGAHDLEFEIRPPGMKSTVISANAAYLVARVPFFRNRPSFQPFDLMGT